MSARVPISAMCSGFSKISSSLKEFAGCVRRKDVVEHEAEHECVAFTRESRLVETRHNEFRGTAPLHEAPA